MKQIHPFYIDRHPGSLCLDGIWQFGFRDTPTDAPAPTDMPYTCTLPASGYRNLCEAGLLPDPYFGDNSKLYRDVDKRTYYYSRSFSMEVQPGKQVFLCFEGVSYTCRVWLNGTLLCSHEGMFGGPVCRIEEYLVKGENRLTVEVTAPACAGDGGRAVVAPWNICRDTETSNGDFVVFGIWRSVRIETVSPYHLSRPYLYTESVGEGEAILRFSTEIADPSIDELSVLPNDTSDWSTYTFAFSDGCDLVSTGKTLSLGITLREKTTGREAYALEKEIEIYDKQYLCPDRRFWECQFVEETLTVENPRLWYPKGYGAQELYEVTLTLSDGTEVIDCLTFDTAIRTVTLTRTAAQRARTRWDDLRYMINGRPTFIRGINWMPADFLYDCSDADLRWLLELARDAGISMLRVWSGGGMPEDDRFYRLCDEMGLMVMQDHMIANHGVETWDREVLQAQEAYNLYRIRNHPSLAVHTGGNENNPYAVNNDAAVWVIRREIEDLDPARPYFRTSPHGGSAHVYRDMEPVWYRKLYNNLPFLAESGIHCFPNAKTLRGQISAEEYNRTLDNIFTDAFKETNPQLVNHFTEFIPTRIPRMLSRASMLCDVHGLSVPEICEATQMASHEFYQIMVNAMREKYPVCCGILPWVFNRPWSTVAVQLIDGFGDTTAPYYAVKNAYAPLCAEAALQEITYAPGEEMIPTLKLLCDDVRPYEDLRVTYTILDPALSVVYCETAEAACSGNMDHSTFAFAPFTIPNTWSERYFMVVTDVRDGSGALLHRSTYPCKVLARLSDDAEREAYRSAPGNNLIFEEGPWLKPQIGAVWSRMQFTFVSGGVLPYAGERLAVARVAVSNIGDVPLYPVRLDTAEDGCVTWAEDSYFLLMPGETRELSLRIRIRDASLERLTLTAASWNGGEKRIGFSL